MQIFAGFSRPSNKASPVPRRSPPPPPSSKEPTRNPSPPSLTSRAGGGGGSLGAFWSSQHAKDTPMEDSSGPKFDEETTSHSTSKDRYRPENNYYSQNASPPREANIQARSRRRPQGNLVKSEEVPSKDFEIRFFQEDSNHSTERPKASKAENTATFQNDAFNTFVAEFDTSKLGSGSNANKSAREEELEAETERLKEQLKQANLEKSEITSKFEKLSAICRSQRQEIQELKQALAARTPSPNRDAPENKTLTGLQSSASPLVSSPIILSYFACLSDFINFLSSIHVPNRFFSHKQHGEKIEATLWELQQRKSYSPASDSKGWQAFSDETKRQPLSKNNSSKSVRTRNGQPNKPATEETWGFGTESFTATPGGSSSFSSPTVGGNNNNAQLFGESKKIESKSATQPAGWAGF